jgi:hypothetical protein
MRKLVLIAILAGAAPAFAQAPSATPTAPAAWPDAISDRPATMNAGGLEIHGSVPIFAIPGGTGGGSTETLVLAGGGIAYGISDQLEIGGDYAFEAHPSTDAAGVFAGHALIRLMNDAQMTSSVGGGVLYSHSGDGVVVSGGINLRYRITPQISLYTMSSGVPVCGGCLHILGPVTGQLFAAIPTSGGGNTLVLLNLPVGIGIQAAPNLYLFGETSLATFELSPKTDSISIADYLGINVGGWISASNQLDIGASFGDSLKYSGDIYLIELMMKLHI